MFDRFQPKKSILIIALFLIGFSSSAYFLFYSPSLTGALVIGIQDAANSTLCGYVDTNLTLTSNVQANGTCFTVNASNIVLNCAGYSINFSTIGNRAGQSDYGINISYRPDLSHFDNVTIKNCIIFDGNLTPNTDHKAIYSIGVNISIINNTITTYGSDADGIYQSAISFSSSNSTNISLNRITTYGSDADGIYIINSFGDYISENNITVYNADGMNIGISSNETVENNIINVFGNAHSGIWSTVTENSTYAYNTVNKTNGSSGTVGAILITDTGVGKYFNNVSFNTIYTYGEGDIGISLTTDTHATSVVGNRVITTNLTAYGVYVEGSNNNIIIDNNITTTLATGVLLLTNANNTLLINNNISSGDYYEINDTSGRNNTLYYNNSFGFINWSRTNLTTNLSLSLNETIFLKNNLVGLLDLRDSLKLNYTAGNMTRIQLFGLSFSATPSLNKNSVRCDDTNDCAITSYANGILAASVTSFSNYSVDVSCGLINTNTTLIHNVNSSGTCFTINASNIVLNCAGYSINFSTIGNRAGQSDYGINNSFPGGGARFDNVTIKNCVIFDGNLTPNTDHTAIYSVGVNISIINNTITTYGSDAGGISKTGTSFSTSNSSNISLNRITTYGEAAEGIVTITSFGDYISENNITVYNADGMNIGVSSNETVENNIVKVLGNGRSGIWSSVTENSTYAYNTINKTNGSSGSVGAILVSDTGVGKYFNNVSFNTIYTYGEGDIGISLTTDTHATSVVGNRVITTNLTAYGVYVEGSNNNIIIDNNITTTLATGVLLLTNANNTLLINNNISSGDYYEINDTSGRNNTLYYNNSFGFINWSRTNLTTNLSLSLNDTIFLKNNLVGILDLRDSLKLNYTAGNMTRIQLFGLSFSETPCLYKEGVRCDNTGDCPITSYANGILAASVTSFSNYSAAGCPVSPSGSSSSSSSPASSASPPATESNPAVTDQTPTPQQQSPEAVETYTNPVDVVNNLNSNLESVESITPTGIISTEEQSATESILAQEGYTTEEIQTIVTESELISPLKEIPIVFKNEGNKSMTITLDINNNLPPTENEEKIKTIIRNKILAENINKNPSPEEVEDLVEEKLSTLKRLDLENVHLILKKTSSLLGLEKCAEDNSVAQVNTVSGFVPTCELITGNLLKPELLLKQKTIELKPGETIDKNIIFRQGIAKEADHSLKITVSSLGQPLLERAIESKEAGTIIVAADTSPKEGLLDLYWKIPAIPKATPSEINNLLLEVSVNDAHEPTKYHFLNKLYQNPLLKKTFGVTTHYTDLFGPYSPTDSEIFVQQLRYDNAKYRGTYDMTMRVFQNNRVIHEKKFKIRL